MNSDALRLLFPKASEDFIRANTTNHQVVAARLPVQKPKPDKRKGILATRKAYEGSCRRPTVIITRCSTGSLDRDNLYSSTKKIIDCLFADGRIPGDTEDDIELFVFQNKVSRKNRGTLIEIIPFP